MLYGSANSIKKWKQKMMPTGDGMFINVNNWKIQTIIKEKLKDTVYILKDNLFIYIDL